jgi:hypothetical protein
VFMGLLVEMKIFEEVYCNRLPLGYVGLVSHMV